VSGEKGSSSRETGEDASERRGRKAGRRMGSLLTAFLRWHGVGLYGNIWNR
jgi:hypothetical protein